MAKKPTSLDAIMSSAVANAAPVENSEAETSQPVTIPVAQSSGRSPQTKSITMYTSPQGLKKLKDELQHARTTERQKIANDIAEARAQGDLSENAEYDAAKEAQGHLEARIARLESTIGNARVVDESEVEKLQTSLPVFVSHAPDAEFTPLLVRLAELSKRRCRTPRPFVALWDEATRFHNQEYP